MFLSVIIPTLNRASTLRMTLDSLVSQTYPSDMFEVIVVDNGSRDGTLSICETFKNKLQTFYYIHETSPGLHAGRHAGLKAAKGEVLVYADDDIRAFPTWLEGIAESFQNPEVMLVGGKILPEFESQPPSWFNELWQVIPWGKIIGYYSLLDFGDKLLEISSEYVWGCNFSIRKDFLAKIGGFHPDSMPLSLIRYRGDGETAVARAVNRMGYKTIYNPRASVYHWVSKDRMNIGYLYRRAFGQGISDSYTLIRANGKTIENGFLISLYNSMKAYLRRFHLSRFTKKSLVQKNIRKGYWDGFYYHQNQARRDPELVKWIFKKNYLTNTFSYTPDPVNILGEK